MADTNNFLESFALETTIHGMKWTTKGYFIIRLLWILAVLTVFSICGLGIYEKAQHFLTNPEETTYYKTYLTRPPDIAITICNLNSWRKSVTEKYNLTELAELIVENNTDPGKIFDKYRNFNFNFTDIEFEAAHNSSLYHCRWTLGSCKEYFKKTFTQRQVCNTAIFKNKSNISNSFISNLEIYLDVEEDEYSYGFGSKAVGFKVLVHDPGRFPYTLDDAFYIPSGTLAVVNLQIQEQDSDETHWFKFWERPACKIISTDFPNYPQNACEMQCYLKYIMKYCNCRPAFSFEPNNKSLCGLNEIISCKQHYFGIHYIEDSCLNDCRLYIPCKYTTFSSQISYAHFPSEIERNTALFKNTSINYSVALEILIPRTMIKVNRHLYNSMDFLADIGGLLGCFCGASLLSALEVLQLIAQMTCFWYSSNSSKSKVRPHNTIQKIS